MRLGPRTVRLRLALWYAGALAVIILIFATAVYFLVKTSLFGQLDERLSTSLSAIERVLPEEPDELGEIEEHGSAHLFQVRKDGRVIFQTDNWKELGLQQEIHNAIKYTRAGGTIRLRVQRLKNGEAAIEIIDQGPGIPPQHQEKIFERFYRVEKGRSRDNGGTGLGLAIARWAVQANGGKIELDSQEGHGSAFRILLPTRETSQMGPSDSDPIRKGDCR